MNSPFVLSPSKHEHHEMSPFDKLTANGNYSANS